MSCQEAAHAALHSKVTNHSLELQRQALREVENI